MTREQTAQQVANLSWLGLERTQRYKIQYGPSTLVGWLDVPVVQEEIKSQLFRDFRFISGYQTLTLTTGETIDLPWNSEESRLGWTKGVYVEAI